jgi:hypothetical protein
MLLEFSARVAVIGRTLIDRWPFEKIRLTRASSAFAYDHIDRLRD